MKSIKFFIMFSTLLLLPVVTFGWEITNEKNTHEVINDAAVTYFNSTLLKQKQQKYEKITLDSSATFSGIAWHEGSNILITQNNQGVYRTENFQNWVMIGGVDADIDSDHGETVKIEIPIVYPLPTFTLATFYLEKPLRHFYDPVIEPAYLTDGNLWLQEYVLANPKVNHIDWATKDPNHPWNFQQGLRLFKAAMELKNKAPFAPLPPAIASFPGYFLHNNYDVNGAFTTAQDALFAASFRALGETLHCAGDMSIPAHVRDDSHSGNAAGGGIDYIEATIGFSQARDILFQHGTSLLNDIELPIEVTFTGQSVTDILKTSAIFTNKNFFSKDSIRDAILGIEAGADEYSSSYKVYPDPSFSDSDIIKKDLINQNGSVVTSKMYKKFSNSDLTVVMAELTPASVVFGITGKLFPASYHIPPSAAKSQAKVLLPMATIAGAEIIDRFIPTLVLNISVTESGKNGTTPLSTVKGDLLHKIVEDPDWKDIGAITYNGVGELLINGKTSTSPFVSFDNGVMTPLTDRTFNDGDIVQVMVKTGGLILLSNEVKVKANPIPAGILLTNPVTTGGVGELISFEVNLDSIVKALGYPIDALHTYMLRWNFGDVNVAPNVFDLTGKDNTNVATHAYKAVGTYNVKALLYSGDSYMNIDASGTAIIQSSRKILTYKSYWDPLHIKEEYSYYIGDDGSKVQHGIRNYYYNGDNGYYLETKANFIDGKKDGKEYFYYAMAGNQPSREYEYTMGFLLSETQYDGEGRISLITTYSTEGWVEKAYRDAILYSTKSATNYSDIINGSPKIHLKTDYADGSGSEGDQAVSTSSYKYISIGVWKYWYKNGQTSETGEYNTFGNKIKLWLYYFESGQMSREVKYTDTGVMVSRKEWDATGKLISSQTF